MILKVGVSAGLMTYLLFRIDAIRFIDTLSSVHLSILILSCGLLFVQQGVMVFSWGILLWSQEKGVPYHRILYAHLVGNFFGSFLPSAVGIDVIRAYNLSKGLKRGIHAVSSLFLCRTVAFIILFLMAMAFVVPVARLTGNRDLFYLLFVIFLFFLLFLFTTYHPRTFQWLLSIFRRLHAEPLAVKLDQFRYSLLELSTRKAVLLRLAVLTVVFQVLGILVVYLLGISLEISVDLAYYFILIPVIMVVTLLPISLAGIGVREASFVYLFSQVGATEAQGFSLSLLMFFQSILLALIGGAVYGMRNVTN